MNLTKFDHNPLHNILFFISIWGFFLSPNFGAYNFPVFLLVSALHFIILLMKKPKIYYSNKFTFFGLFFLYLLTYSSGISWLYNDNLHIDNIVFFGRYVFFIFFFYAYLKLFSQLFLVCPSKFFEYFLAQFCLTLFVNSLIIHASVQFESFSILMDTFVSDHPSSGISAHDGRYKGLSSTGGTSLSLLYCFGVVSSFVLLVNKRINFVLFIFLNISTFSALLFIGRTGIILASFFVMLVLLYGILSLKKKAVLSFFLLFPAVALVTQMHSLLESKVFSYNFGYLREGLDWFLYSDSTLDGVLGYYEQGEIDLGSILVGRGDLSGNYSGSVGTIVDSGYLKTLSLVGFPFGFIVYGYIIWLSLKFFKNVLVKNSEKIFLFIVLAFGFLVEFKQQVIFSSNPSRFILALLIIGSFFPLNKQFQHMSVNK